jgi:uncharacterized lipoprotein YddW (UPF0748 family)
VLQVYRDRIEDFQLELAKPEVIASKEKMTTIIGLLTGLRTRPINSDIVREQVVATMSNQFSGLSCFFYETLFHERLTPTLVSRSKEQLFTIFSTDNIAQPDVKL